MKTIYQQFILQHSYQVIISVLTYYLVRIGFLLEQFRRHLVKYIHVDTYDQIADILTKPLGEGDFVRLRHMLLGCKVPYRKV
jgi:hypothetical protein